MLVLDSVFFNYNEHSILRGVYLSIEPGSINGLFGNNGSGKSTLMKICAGFLKQQNGKYFIDGEVILNDLQNKRYRHIAYLSQEPFLPNDVTVKKALQMCGVNKIIDRKDKIVDKILPNRIDSLSGGELRYLQFLILIELNRKYYLLDEPFTGIEPIFVERIINLLLVEKQKGKGILISDHNYRYLIDIIDKCYILKDGRIRQFSEPKNFRDELIKSEYLIK